MTGPVAVVAVVAALAAFVAALIGGVTLVDRTVDPDPASVLWLGTRFAVALAAGAAAFAVGAAVAAVVS